MAKSRRPCYSEHVRLLPWRESLGLGAVIDDKITDLEESLKTSSTLSDGKDWFSLGCVSLPVSLILSLNQDLHFDPPCISFL